MIRNNNQSQAIALPRLGGEYGKVGRGCVYWAPYPLCGAISYQGFMTQSGVDASGVAEGFE